MTKREYLLHFNGVSAYPERAELYLSNQCNLRCRYCYIDNSRRNKKELAAAQWLTALEKLASAKVQNVFFSGGEPLSHPGFDEILQKTLTLPMRFSITSNGCLLTEERARAIGQSHRCDAFQLSLDGPEKLHDAARGHGSFSGAMNALALCRRNQIPVITKMTIGSHNAGHLMECADFFFDTLRLPIVATNYVSSLGEVTVDLELPAEQFEVVMKEMSEVIRKYPGKFTNEGPWPIYRFWKKILAGKATPLPVRPVCPGACKGFAVMTDGQLRPCAMMDKEWDAGSILELDLLTYWRTNPALAELRQSTRPAKCKDCEYSSCCPGRCPVKSFYCLKEFLMMHPNFSNKV